MPESLQSFPITIERPTQTVGSGAVRGRFEMRSVVRLSDTGQANGFRCKKSGFFTNQ